MKEYELSILFHPDLEMNPDPAVTKVKKLIEASGGKIIKEEPEGKKRLCYPINGNEYALYYYFDANLPASAPSKISSTLGITDEVIRYLIVKADPRRAKYLAVKAEEEAKAEETKASEPKTDESKSSEETATADLSTDQIINQEKEA